MFLPIGDSPNPERFTPYVTWGLIALNVAVYILICLPLSATAPEGNNPLLRDYINMLLAQGVSPEYVRAILAQTSLNDLLLFQYGYKPADPSVISLFSSLFLHAGFMHLAGNMLFLYIYGDNVEHQLGRMRFLLMYLATGVIATLSFALLAGNSMTPLVGASGAISGVLGFYFYMFPKNKVKVFIMLLPIFINVVKIPARIVLGIYVLIDNLLPILVQAGGNVAYGAHLGGFFGGLGIAVAGEYFGWKSPFSRDSIRPFSISKMTSTKSDSNTTTVLTQIRKAYRDGDVETMVEALKHANARDFATLSVEEMIGMAKLIENYGFPLPANKLLKIAISTHKGSSRLPEVYYELGRIRFQQGFPTAAYQHLLTALDHYPSEVTEAKIRGLLQKIKI